MYWREIEIYGLPEMFLTDIQGFIIIGIVLKSEGKFTLIFNIKNGE